MSRLPTPPRLGLRVPLPPAPRDGTDDDVTAEADGLRPGDLLDGRYQIEERIGEGGLAFVYRALQLKLHRRVAVKLLQREMIGDEELRPRFEREAITLAALAHPHIVSVQDYGVVRGQPFLVMELLEGRTLREVIDSEGALPPGRALTLTRQMVLALAHAHQLGIVHRDLKPANLLVQALPVQEHLKVLDFGLVKLLPGSYLDRGVQLSRVGFTFGTPPYMSPEHATGGQVDGRSDLYSVGVLLFEMLTGQKPFDGELHEVIRHHLSTPVPKLADRRPELAGRDELQALVEGCLAKLRDERFPSALDLLRVLDAAVAATAERTQADTLPPAPAEPEAPGLEVRAAFKALGTAHARLAAALLLWVRLVIGPWIRRTRERTGTSLSELGKRTQASARAGWDAAKPRLENAKEQLQRAAEGAKARFSSRPPPMQPVDGDGEEAAADRPAEPQASEVAASPAAANAGDAAPAPLVAGGEGPSDDDMPTQLGLPKSRESERPAPAPSAASGVDDESLPTQLGVPKARASERPAAAAPGASAADDDNMPTLLAAPRFVVGEAKTLDLGASAPLFEKPDAPERDAEKP